MPTAATQQASVFQTFLRKLLSASALLVFFNTGASASGDTFKERCNNLASQSQIEVVFEDSLVKRDDSRTKEELGRLAQSNQNPNHIVLGLTHAEPFANSLVTTQFLADQDGITCAVPSIKVKLGFLKLQVYLAKELDNTCHQSIVLSHEQEHIAVWRNHLRAGSKLLTHLLKSEFRQATYFSNREEAGVILRQRVQSSIALQLTNLKLGILQAHKQIDSPASYRYEQGRMLACP